MNNIRKLIIHTILPNGDRVSTIKYIDIDTNEVITTVPDDVYDTIEITCSKVCAAP